VRRIEADRLAPLRAAAQLLHRPAGMRHAADVARAICGAQAQDPTAGRLAFRSRSRTLSASEVDRARTEERALVRTWAMRGTMHLLAADDVEWLVPLFAGPLADNSRKRLGELGMPPPHQERALREIAAALADGPLGRDALAERIERRRIELDPPRRFHVFRLAVALGIACHGPDANGATCLALREDWLGEPRPRDRGDALRELARRYLRAFGPATEADFAGWSGLGRRDAREALAGVAGDLVEVRIGGERAWTVGRAPRPGRRGLVRLLPAWDTYLMGHRDRDFVAAGADWRRVMPGGGVLRPTVLVDGAAVATWSARRGRGGLRVEVDPFGDLDGPVRAAVESEVADLGRFEGLPATLHG
jgi:hypothetical protein